VSSLGNEHDLAPIHLPLYEDEARHLLDGLTHPTNAMTLNGYSCPTCREIGDRLRPLLPDASEDTEKQSGGGEDRG
jgi:hypothetical protein